MSRCTGRLVRLAAVVAACGFGFAAPALGQEASVGDFIPLISGGTAKIQEPEKVEVEEDTVTAASPQDAMNAGLEETKKDIAAGDRMAGAVLVSFPSGMGVLATGRSTYTTHENVTATQIAKRKAYVIAFTQAKKELAAFLDGIDNEGKERIREELTNVNLTDQEMTNISTRSEESLRQCVDMMLRGFVIYEVDDDDANGEVFVSIVTTPKTRGQVARSAAHAIEAASLQAGLEQAIAEIKSGVVPPIGGRIITIRETGETAFVGFGAAVVGQSANRAAQSQLKYKAQTIARARAQDALCGLIRGDQTSWQGTLDDRHQQEFQEFVVADTPEPLNNPSAFQKLDQARESFVSVIKTSDVYESARKGKLPPGVPTKTYFDSDGAWAYGIAVYSPSMSKAVEQIADEVRGAEIVPEKGKTGAKSGGVKKPPVKKGPSGKVSDDDDL